MACYRIRADSAGEESGVETRYTHSMAEIFHKRISDLTPDSRNANKGSERGSQIIAAEKMGRKCYAMELDPRYVDVAVTRWEQATGKKAVLSAE